MFLVLAVGCAVSVDEGGWIYGAAFVVGLILLPLGRRRGWTPPPASWWFDPVAAGCFALILISLTPAMNEAPASTSDVLNMALAGALFGVWIAPRTMRLLFAQVAKLKR